MIPTENVYFVHISDTHIGSTTGYSRHGHLALPHAQRIVDIINKLPVQPDFVVHTGDVVSNPSPEAYARAAKTLSRIQVPIYYVNGNHDTAVSIKQHMTMGPKQDLLPNPDKLTYAFEVKGYRFLVLDGKGPEEIQPHGILSADQMEIVQREAQTEGPPLTIFVHFPALPMNSTWMDTNMPLLNGTEFHEALLPARERLRGVFYGHVHHSLQTVRDGIVYTAVRSTFSQFTAWPHEELVQSDFYERPGYNFVHLLPEQTIVHQHTFGLT